MIKTAWQQQNGSVESININNIKEGENKWENFTFGSKITGLEMF